MLHTLLFHGNKGIYDIAGHSRAFVFWCVLVFSQHDDIIVLAEAKFVRF